MASRVLYVARTLGRHCVGAVQLLGLDKIPSDVQQITGTAVSESEIEALLIQTTGGG
jgi:serine/threonine-protein kinase HipA